MYNLKMVALVLLVTFALGSVEAANLCDSCKCLPSKGVVKSVFCECDPGNKAGLNITRDVMKSLAHIEAFSVSNCRSVTFHQSSFASSEDLHTVTISRAGVVTLPHGVFSAMSSLVVEDVGDLRLEKYAFMGAGDIEEIAIRRSNISVLPSHSLYGVKGLKKIELSGVIIDVIQSSAIDITMADQASFIIDSCEVETVQPNAVVLHTGSLHINHSVFENISPKAVNVSATEAVDIRLNVFGAGCSNEGLAVQSNAINIFKNTFFTLPIGLLTRPEDSTSSITFTDNDVYNFTLLNDGVALSTMLNLDIFKNNAVICDCDLARSVLTYTALQVVSTAHITEQNYCHLESKCKISLKMLSQETTQVCEKSDPAFIETLCEILPPGVTPTLPVTAVESTTGARDPKYLASEEDIITTTPTESSTAADGKQHLAAGMISSGWAYRSNMILVAIIGATTAAKYIGFNC